MCVSTPGQKVFFHWFNGRGCFEKAPKPATCVCPPLDKGFPSTTPIRQGRQARHIYLTQRSYDVSREVRAALKPRLDYFLANIYILLDILYPNYYPQPISYFLNYFKVYFSGIKIVYFKIDCFYSPFFEGILFNIIMILILVSFCEETSCLGMPDKVPKTKKVPRKAAYRCHKATRSTRSTQCCQKYCQCTKQGGC